MKKILLLIVILAIAGLSFYFFKDSNKVDYVATIDGEVAGLQLELEEIEMAVNSGKITPQEAVDARVRIASRLENINDAIDASGKATLSKEQKAMLSGALSKLSDTLSKFRATLVTVEATATTAEANGVKPTLNTGNGKVSRNRSLVVLITETASSVAEVTGDVIDDTLEELTDSIDDSLLDDDSSMEDESEITDEEDDSTPESDDSMEDDSMMDEDSMDDDMDSSTSTDEELETQ